MATPKIYIDLTTLSGWEDLPMGTYDITVAAKSEEYSRIVQSSPVQIRKVGDAFITFSSLDEFTLSTANNSKKWDGRIEFSTDKTTWMTWNGNDTLYSVNGKLYLRGVGNTHITTSMGSTCAWVLTGTNISCDGNIENLLDYQTVLAGYHPTMAEYCYERMFRNCASLVSAPELPAVALTNYCYEDMFSGCTSLTRAPQLPATSLTNHCYAWMFSGCTSLTTAPSLPANMYSEYNEAGCYYGMFKNCTSLTTIPNLPSTYLSYICYCEMFSGCTSLYISDTQTPEAQYAWSIPANGTLQNNYTNPMHYGYMFGNCLGTRANDDFSGDAGNQYTYYTQNPPV